MEEDNLALEVAIQNRQIRNTIFWVHLISTVPNPNFSTTVLPPSEDGPIQLGREIGIRIGTEDGLLRRKVKFDQISSHHPHHMIEARLN